MELTDLLNGTGEWLKGTGPECPIVISSRVRLARNLQSHLFSTRIGEAERAELAARVREALGEAPSGRPLTYFDLETATPRQSRLMLERHLISREQAEGDGARGVAVNAEETLAVMVNEEDHLRLQGLRSGLQLESTYDMVDRLDDELAERLDYAFDEEFGYLTACPTNVGTGLRVSVMLHLPALVITRHIEKVIRSVHDMKLAVRGLYGEGTEAHGELYQISNQITVGRPETEIVADLQATIEGVVAYEKKARERLLEAEPKRLEDRVWRAYAALRHARVISSEEAMQQLSAVRLGITLGLLPSFDMKSLNMIFLLIQPAHLQQLAGRDLPAEERDVARADYIREQFDKAAPA